MTTPSKVLAPLFAKLRVCPSQDSRFSEKLLLETWRGFKQSALEQGNEPTPAIIVALILHDTELFAQLLNVAERSQLAVLARLALERYQQKTNPPNKLGKLIAAALKDQV